MKILLASNNPKKAHELRTILANSGIEILTLADVPHYDEPIEDGRTFADDSGFTVEELNGCPGVLSARWSGQHGDDQANNLLLLKQMAHVPEERRQAAFVSVCALVVPNGEEHVVTGQWDGWMLTEPRGDNGFGYDPLCLPNEDFPNGRSSAQLSTAEKNALSHRGKALAQLVPIVTQLSQLSEANSD